MSVSRIHGQPLLANVFLLVTPTTEYTLLLDKLTCLQTDLVDLAFRLESQGRIDAADIAVTTSVRIGELCAELVSASGSDPVTREGRGPA